MYFKALESTWSRIKDRLRRGFCFGRTLQKCTATVPRARRDLGGMDTDDLLASLAWRAIRDWRLRRDVDPATGGHGCAAVRRGHPVGATGQGDSNSSDSPATEPESARSSPSNFASASAVALVAAQPRRSPGIAPAGGGAAIPSPGRPTHRAAAPATHRSEGSRLRAGGRVHGVRRWCRGQSWVRG